MQPHDGLEALIDAVTQATQQDGASALGDAAQRLWEAVIDTTRQCKTDKSVIESVQNACKRATLIWVCADHAAQHLNGA